MNRELVGLGVILAAATAVRLIGLDLVEPNILGDEADHLTLLFRIVDGRGPGLFDLSWDGNPAASLYPAIPFLLLVDSDIIGLRASSAVGSLLALLIFYRLAHLQLSVFASLAATALLAFSGWFLFFSRNGEVNVWAVVYLLGASYFCQRAVRTDRAPHWVAAGACCGLGWYAYLGGALILPCLLIYLAAGAVLRPEQRGRQLRGGLVIALVCLAMLIPRLPVLIEEREALGVYIGTRSVLKELPPDDVLPTLAQQVWISLRAYLLLDGSQPGNPRYVQPGTAVLDPLSGGLYLIGLALSFSHKRDTLLWWCIFGTYALAVQSLTLFIPDAARALLALPAMILFAGLAIDWLSSRPTVGRLPIGRLATIILAAAIPTAAAANVYRYVEWQREPANAFARQPAVETADFPAWRQAQLEAMRNDQPGFNVIEWQRGRFRERLPGR